jgi:hypothetical protein
MTPALQPFGWRPRPRRSRRRRRGRGGDVVGVADPLDGLDVERAAVAGGQTGVQLPGQFCGGRDRAELADHLDGRGRAAAGGAGADGPRHAELVGGTAGDGQVGEQLPPAPGQRGTPRPGAGSATRSRCRPRSRSASPGRRPGRWASRAPGAGRSRWPPPPCCVRCSSRRCRRRPRPIPPRRGRRAARSPRRWPGHGRAGTTSGSRAWPAGPRGPGHGCRPQARLSAGHPAPPASSEGRGGRIGGQVAEGVRLAEDHRQQRRARHAERVRELQELTESFRRALVLLARPGASKLGRIAKEFAEQRCIM